MSTAALLLVYAALAIVEQQHCGRKAADGVATGIVPD